MMNHTPSDIHKKERTLQGSAVPLLLVFATFVLGSCTKVSSPVSPSPTDTTVSFSSQVQPIFTQNCALSGCHSGPQPQDGLNLGAGSSYSQIVNVPCVDVPGYLIIKPFKPDSSFLYLKIMGSPVAGIRMPYQRAPLDSDLIATIRNWINQGSPNN